MGRVSNLWLKSWKILVLLVTSLKCFKREKEIKKENRYTNSQIAVFKHFGVEIYIYLNIFIYI